MTASASTPRGAGADGGSDTLDVTDLIDPALRPILDSHFMPTIDLSADR